MYQIDEILVDQEILNSKFSCDLKKCKGACCTFPGDNGAPLKDDEVQSIMASLEVASKYLSPKSLRIIESKGFFDGKKGAYYTRCINKRDCVFVYYEGDIAKCSLERAYFNGESNFRKPISCHLFPIRVGSFGGDYLYYEKISECNPAIIKGESENTSMVSFTKDSLTRAYGKKWVEKLEELDKKDI